MVGIRLLEREQHLLAARIQLSRVVRVGGIPRNNRMRLGRVVHIGVVRTLRIEGEPQQPLLSAFVVHALPDVQYDLGRLIRSA